jgi:alpha-maltose-1-phosphate synthase
MEKKKILVCNLTPRWGMLHYSSQFCNELSKRNDLDLKVAIASYHDSVLYDSGITFIKIRTNPNLFSFIFDSLNIFYHVYFLYNIFKYSPDIVHFLDNHPWYSFYVKIFRLFWYEIYVTQHDPTLHSWETSSVLWKIAAYTNKVLRNTSDRLFVHWDILKEEVVKRYNISENRVFSIRHGAYTFFNKWAQWLAVQRNTFLFFWRILDYKGLDILLWALGQVKKSFPDFQLIIAWPWDITSYKKELNIFKENIKIYNYNIEPEEAYKFFEISEFVVLPYKDATGSWVVPVSYSFSKAVLATNVWELVSVVEDGKTWYLVETNNSEVLWQKIVEMLQEKDRIKSMWKEWKIFSDEQLSWSDIIVKVYK